MYKSPIELIYQGVEMQIERGIVKAVHKQDIIVDKEELIRALEYDRGQYKKGYADAMDSIVRCKDCKHRFYSDFDGCYVCHHGGFNAINADHFCSYGERRIDD